MNVTGKQKEYHFSETLQSNEENCVKLLVDTTRRRIIATFCKRISLSLGMSDDYRAPLTSSIKKDVDYPYKAQLKLELNLQDSRFTLQ